MNKYTNKLDVDICDEDITNINQDDEYLNVNFACAKLPKEQTYITNNIFYPCIDDIKTRLNDDVSKNNLYKEFGTPYVAVLKNMCDYKSYYFDKMITNEQLNELKESIEIIPVNYKILCGNINRYLTIMSANNFNQFTVKDKYENTVQANKDVLLFCLLRFNVSNYKRYIKQFDGLSNFIDLYNALLMNDFLGQYNKTSTIKQNHIQMISNMEESNYYTIHNNCQLNITSKFKSRGFNLSLTDRLADKSIQNVLKYLEDSKEDNNYLDFIFKKASFLDASSAVNIGSYKLYKITSNFLTENMTNNHFNNIYDRLTNKEKYYLIMNCMISKELCHLVINNKYILDKINSSDIIHNDRSFLQKYGHIFKYALGYTWLTLYMEESIKKTFIEKKDRFIFDIETASKLIWYPYSKENLNICPYLPILIEKETLNSEKNILGVQQIIINDVNKEFTRYGVTTKDKFIERLNMFISGGKNINILENINWDNIAISGSIMACCLPNFNPLMCNFILDNNLNIDFLNYINEYYKDADVDVMCNILDIYKFIDKIYEFKNQLELNIIKNNELQSSINIVNLQCNTTCAIMINKNFIKTYLVKESGLDYVTILSNLHQENIKNIVYKHYINWHKNYILESIKENPSKFIDPKYHDIYIPVSINNINVIFIKTNIDKQEDENQLDKIIKEIKLNDDIDIEEDDNDCDNELKYEREDIYDEIPSSNIVFIPKVNHKFKINSSYLPHSFEFFQIKYPEFFSTVSRFHLPIVRSYYDGSDVYITPSCISACMTMLNIDYKYFAGSKDPIEIINKYRMRGFGTILNDKEIIRLIEYSSLVPKWKQLYSLNIKSNTSVINNLGTLPFTSQFFNPSLVLYNKTYSIYLNLNNFIHINVPINQNDINELINKLYDCNNNLHISIPTTINKFGFVNPIKKWLIDAFYENN